MYNKTAYEYAVVEVGENFSNTPGTFVLDRLINQQPGIFYQTDAATPVFKKKHLIINEKSVDFLCHSIFETFIKLMLLEGFEISQVQHRQLFPLNTFENFFNNRKSLIENEHELYTLLNSHKLEKDKVAVLDHEVIGEICSENPFLNSSVHCTLTSFPGLDTPDLLQSVSLDGFLPRLDTSHWSFQNLTWLKIATFELNSQNLDEINQGSPKIRHLDLHFSNPTRLDLLFASLAQFKSLVSLKLSGPLPPLENMQVELTSLKSLFLAELAITATDLENLLVKMPNLELLDLESVGFSGKFSAHLSHKSLRHIFAKHIEPDYIFSLLNGISALESLYLFHIKGPCTHIPKKQPHLRVLSLEASEFNASSLNPLLSSRLGYLKISDTTTIKGTLAPAEPLAALDAIDIDRYSVMDMLSLTNLLNQTDNLKSITIFIENIQDTFHLTSPLVSKKEKLDTFIVKSRVLELLFESNLNFAAKARQLKIIYPHLSDYSNLSHVDFALFNACETLSLPKISLEPEAFILFLRDIQTTKAKSFLVSGEVPLLKVGDSIPSFNLELKPEGFQLVLSYWDEEFLPEVLAQCPQEWQVQLGGVTFSKKGQALTEIKKICELKSFDTWEKIDLNHFLAWKNLNSGFSSPIISSSRLRLGYSFHAKPSGITFYSDSSEILVCPGNDTLTIQGKITAIAFAAFLEKLPKEKYLTLNQLEITGDFDNLPKLQFPKVTFMAMQISIKNLRFLANRLRAKLVFKNCHIEMPASGVSALPVFEVETDSETWNQSLFSLFKGYTISLSPSPGHTLKTNSSLTCLEIVDDNGSYALLKQITRAFPALELLKFFVIDFSDYRGSDACRLKVEALEIDNRILRNREDFAGFMACFSHLKTFRLSELEGENFVNFKSLTPQLEQLSLGTVKANIRDLQYLLKNLPDNAKLDIGTCEFTGAPKALESLLKAWPNFHINFLQKCKLRLKETIPEKEVQNFTADHDPAVVLDAQWSQSMLIHRLMAWHYLIDKPEVARNYAQRIKKGICSAVAKFFADTVEKKSLKAWSTCWNRIKSWDGREAPSGKIERALKALDAYVFRYQLASTVPNFWDSSKFPIALSMNVLKSLEKPQKWPLMINNAWHRTCLYHHDNQWFFLDPNYRSGEPQAFVRLEDCVDEIYRVLGHGLAIFSYTAAEKEVLEEDAAAIDTFFRDGGLAYLFDRPDLIKKFAQQPFSKAALESLFLRTTQNIPFWYHGLANTSSWLIWERKAQRTFILMLLSQYQNQVSQAIFSQTMVRGIGCLNKNRRKLLQEYLDSVSGFNPVKTVILAHLEKTALPVKDEQIRWIQSNREQVAMDKTDPEKPEADREENIHDDFLPVTYPSPLNRVPQPITHPFILETALKQGSADAVLLRSNPFKTWEGIQTQPFETLKDFDKVLLEQTGENLLVHIHQDSSLKHYIHHLQNHAQCKARGLFVINSLEDLHCAIATVEMDRQGKGRIKHSPSGLLYEFLTTRENASPILVVNWSHFTARELVQANTLIDKIRRVDGVTVPANTLVLGLQNPASQGAYLGSDFSSRHDKIYHFPAQLKIPAPVLPADEQAAKMDPLIIDLFEEKNWQGHFYGNWRLTAEGQVFQKSPLLKALESNPLSLHLILKNPPKDEAFEFTLNSFIATGNLDFQGQRFTLSQQLAIQKVSGYDLDALLSSEHAVFEKGFLTAEDTVLNPDSLASFFENYQINNETRQLITLPGLMDNHRGKTLLICVTAPLNLSAWAKLLTMAREQDLRLKIKLAPTVELPVELASRVELLENTREEAQGFARLIISNDISCTEKNLVQDRPGALVVDISELSKDQLFYAMNGQLAGEHFVFDEQESAIWQALRAGRPVILKGEFAPALQNALAQLFKKDGGIYHNGQWERPTGELILLTANPDSFAFAKTREQREESLDDKLHFLSKFEQERLLAVFASADLQGLTFSWLQTLSRTSVLPKRPDSLLDPLIHWTAKDEEDRDSDLEEAKSSAFVAKRRADLRDALKNQPAVFIAGETGVGKSSFMHELEKDPDIQVFFGDFQAWLASDFEKDKILFLDEANLAKTDWSLFEGLYGEPPGIFYQGQSYPLDRHKVVFTGNPANYGGRRVASFFQNHPNVIRFEAMPNAALYHEVLKPVLKDTAEAETIAGIFLQTYQWVKSRHKTAISVRELQMMAYLFKAKSLPENPLERARQITFDLCTILVEKADVDSFKQWFEKTQGVVSEERIVPPASLGESSKKDAARKKMLLKPSHYKIYRWLHDFLAVRNHKQQSSGKASYGGLSGLVLEGEPGVGKSHLVKQMLLEEGFQERKIDEAATLSPFDYAEAKTMSLENSRHFYFIPAKLSLTAKINLLNRAFHEGAIVVIDELNSSALLEDLMNALLMGEDLKGRRALVPGFLLLGTQNPGSMAGRSQSSQALQRRMLHCPFPSYTLAEMTDILVHKGLMKNHALGLIHDYCQALDHARIKGYQPEPAFRDVLKRVKILKKAGQQYSPAWTCSLPFAETVLYQRLDLDKAGHQKLLQRLRSTGFEKFFYQDTGQGLMFLPDNPAESPFAVANLDTDSLVFILQKRLKTHHFRTKYVNSDADLLNELETLSEADLELFLTNARFNNLDFSQLILNLGTITEQKRAVFAKVFPAFCKQVANIASIDKGLVAFLTANLPQASKPQRLPFFAQAKTRNADKLASPTSFKP